MNEPYVEKMYFEGLDVYPSYRIVGVCDIDRLWALRDAEQDEKNKGRAASWAVRFRLSKQR